MASLSRLTVFAAIMATSILFVFRSRAADKIDSAAVLRGPAAFTDYRAQQPGVFHKITPQDLPKPYATKSAANYPSLVPRPNNAWPQAPAGFKVELFASALNGPRLIRTAPNGDFFVAESFASQVKVLRGITARGEPERMSVFATGLRRPFGIAFYPPGADPQWVYVAKHGLGSPVPLQEWRPERPCTSHHGDRKAACGPRPLDAGFSLLPGRKTDVRFGRLAIQRG